MGQRRMMSFDMSDIFCNVLIQKSGTLCVWTSSSTIYYLCISNRFLTSATTNPTAYLATALRQHRLILAILDGVWSCVVGSDVNESLFLEMEGVFLLVDLLQLAPPKLRAPILGAILDLGETPGAIPHLTAWRGNEGIPLASLLCRVWREEEAAIGVKRDENGAISDPAAPLAGSIQRDAAVQAETPASAPSLAVVDVAENQRAKIYAIFCKIGFHSAVGHPKLTVEDHVTMTIIDHYLDFKMAEVWTEVKGELAVEGVKPIKDEREAFDVIDAGITERVAEVRESIQVHDDDDDDDADDDDDVDDDDDDM